MLDFGQRRLQMQGQDLASCIARLAHGLHMQSRGGRRHTRGGPSDLRERKRRVVMSKAGSRPSGYQLR